MFLCSFHQSFSSNSTPTCSCLLFEVLYLLPLGIMCILCLNNKFVKQNHNTFSIVMIVHVEYNGDNTFSIVQAFLRCCTLEQSLLCFSGQVWFYLKTPNIYITNIIQKHDHTNPLQTLLRNIFYNNSLHMFYTKISTKKIVQTKPTLTQQIIVYLQT